MTISNEAKVGVLSVVAIVFLVLGFNFLKGKSLGSKNTQYVTTFADVQGLAKGNPVVISGKETGIIYDIDGGRDMKQLKVTINMKDDVNIPDDSYAVISKSILGSVQLDIKLGESKTYKKNGDSIQASAGGDLLGDAMKKIDPVLVELAKTLQSLDSVFVTVNSVADKNLRAIMDNLDKTTASLAVSAVSLQTMLDEKNGSVAKTVDNLNSFTGNLKNNNDKLTQTLSNVETATGKFAKLDIETTMSNINSSITQLKTIMETASSNKGTLGLLMNDPKLYNNLNATSNKLNLLLDDLRVHPKRYVNVSVFGKKDKSQPLTVPLPDTVNAPYIPK